MTYLHWLINCNKGTTLRQDVNEGSWRGREKHTRTLYFILNFFVTQKLLRKIKAINFFKCTSCISFHGNLRGYFLNLNALRHMESYPFLVNYNLFSHHIFRFYVTDGENVYSEGLKSISVQEQWLLSSVPVQGLEYPG